MNRANETESQVWITGTLYGDNHSDNLLELQYTEQTTQALVFIEVQKVYLYGLRSGRNGEFLVLGI